MQTPPQPAIIALKETKHGAVTGNWTGACLRISVICASAVSIGFPCNTAELCIREDRTVECIRVKDTVQVADSWREFRPSTQNREPFANGKL